MAIDTEEPASTIESYPLPDLSLNHSLVKEVRVLGPSLDITESQKEVVKHQTEAKNLKHGLIALSLFTLILIIVIAMLLLKYSKMTKRIKDLQMKVSTFEENKPRNIATATDGGIQQQPYDDLDILDEGQPMKAN